MASRYDNRMVATNDNRLYKEMFRERKINFIKQFATPNMKYPSADEISRLETIAHTWTVGDRYYKLAFEYYGDSEMWWIIAWYNQKPTESHVENGETVFIPLPLDKILQFLEI